MTSSEQDGGHGETQVTQRGRKPFLIVGIGASAGGLEALENFFSKMPPDSGMGFVVVTHTPAGRVSLMPELLARHTAMPIVEVKGGTVVEPDHVYLAPGGGHVGILQGTLHLVDRDVTAKQMTIDSFFRSLAQDAKERAVGIVLSGTGSDGTMGVKEIKAQSGMTMAQEEASARYSSMPHSAIVSLQVDYVLSPQDMPRQLIEYAARAGSGRVPVDDNSSDIMARLFLLLRTRTGHDFSFYKSTTIRRRLERRMNVHQLDSLSDYLRYLQANSGELDLLFKELLIGVTSFFRDPEAHEVLISQILPDLLAGKPEGYVIRAWVHGCSTGEEAYSLAIELREAMEKAKVHHGVQVFATDLDPEAIEVARLGAYPESITSDVSPKRLERYFIREEGAYRIKKDIREMLVFAPQSLIEDPPFTKLDLLSCRNLLIYFDGKLQQRLIPLFHYALRPGGILFLGSSETVGNYGHLFEPLDKKWKIFRRREVSVGSYVAELPSSTGDSTVREPIMGLSSQKGADLGVIQTAERALLMNLVPPSILMHERGEIVHIHGRTGQFLEPSPGPQTATNVYNMVREGLQLDLAVAVRHAAASEGEVLHPGVKVKTNGHYVTVDLLVKKLTQPEHLRGLYLVAFERATPFVPAEPGAASPASDGGGSGRLGDLERELQHAKEVHQSTVEELETANEELKSTNEELQSTNEELQSANEELETSKEEMQSLNEELQTVNAELQDKVEELSRANDDMKNLLNGTDIATIFLDNDLSIKRYTEQAKKVIRLIPTDVGRPIGDLVSKLKYTTLADDAAEVLRTLVFKEAEVQSEDGGWYLMRILPYRTTDNVIDGLVVTFVDVTMVKALQEEAGRLVGAVSSSPTTIFGQSADLRYEWACGSLAGHPADQVVGRTDEELFGTDGVLAGLKRQVLEQGKPARRRITLNGNGVRGVHDLFLQPVRRDGGQIVGLSGVLTRLEESPGDK